MTNFTNLVIIYQPPFATLILSFFLLLLVFFFSSLEFFFFLILLGRTFIHPEMFAWGFGLVAQLLFLYLFSFIEEKRTTQLL